MSWWKNLFHDPEDDPVNRSPSHGAGETLDAAYQTQFRSTSTRTTCQPKEDDDTLLQCQKIKQITENGKTWTETENYTIPRDQQYAGNLNKGYIPDELEEEVEKVANKFIDEVGEDLDKMKQIITEVEAFDPNKFFNSFFGDVGDNGTEPKYVFRTWAKTDFSPRATEKAQHVLVTDYKDDEKHEI